VGQAREQEEERQIWSFVFAFVAYFATLFDIVDTSNTYKGKVGKDEVMFATGGYKRQL
jgi:hypothetical protein